MNVQLLCSLFGVHKWQQMALILKILVFHAYMFHTSKEGLLLWSTLCTLAHGKCIFCTVRTFYYINMLHICINWHRHGMSCTQLKAFETLSWRYKRHRRSIEPLSSVEILQCVIDGKWNRSELFKNWIRWRVSTEAITATVEEEVAEKCLFIPPSVSVFELCTNLYWKI